MFLNTNQSLIYLNPSFAGTNGYIRNQASYRNQWPNQTGNFITYLNSFDAFIKPLNGGIAISLLSDIQAHGTLKRTCFSLAYAQHFSFIKGKLKIIPSLQIAFGQERLDASNLSYGDLLDARYGIVWKSFGTTPSANKNYLDLTSGLLVNYKNLYLGAAVFHFNQPDIGLLGAFKLPPLYSMNLSCNKAISENTLLHFAARLMQQQEKTIAQAAVNMVYKNFLVGLGYRSQTTAFITAGFRYNNINCMLAYDRGFGKLYSTPSSWELMLSFHSRKETPKGTTTNLENW